MQHLEVSFAVRHI